MAWCVASLDMIHEGMIMTSSMMQCTSITVVVPHDIRKNIKIDWLQNTSILWTWKNISCTMLFSGVNMDRTPNVLQHHSSLSFLFWYKVSVPFLQVRRLSHLNQNWGRKSHLQSEDLDLHNQDVFILDCPLLKMSGKVAEGCYPQRPIFNY